MSQRINYNAISPDGAKALANVYNYVQKSGLPPELVELVYLRISQINNCAFCLDMHTQALLKREVPVEKLMLVQAWREAEGFFNDKERAALSWAESVTNVTDTGVPDDDFNAVKMHFSDKALVDLTMAISLMNAYNRLSISFRNTPTSTPKQD